MKNSTHFYVVPLAVVDLRHVDCDPDKYMWCRFWLATNLWSVTFGFSSASIASQDGRGDVFLDSLREFYVRIERYFGHFTTPNKLRGK